MDKIYAKYTLIFVFIFVCVGYCFAERYANYYINQYDLTTSEQRIIFTKEAMSLILWTDPTSAGNTYITFDTKDSMGTEYTNVVNSNMDGSKTMMLLPGQSFDTDDGMITGIRVKSASTSTINVFLFCNVSR